MPALRLNIDAGQAFFLQSEIGHQLPVQFKFQSDEPTGQRKLLLTGFFVLANILAQGFYSHIAAVSEQIGSVVSSPSTIIFTSVVNRITALATEGGSFSSSP